MSKTQICCLIIILFHIVGVSGFLIPSLTGLFIKLVPFHLLLMLVLLGITGYDGSSDIVVFAIGVYGAGFLIEAAGVNSGLIFGSYTYGQTLGIKLWNTPLLIGVNWLILIYSIGVFLHKYITDRFLFALLGALMMVSIDFLIEPVAIRYDYWSWSNASGAVPLQNYLGWFVVAFMMFLFFSSLKFKKQNSAAVVILVSQACFFLALNAWGT